MANELTLEQLADGRQRLVDAELHRHSGRCYKDGAPSPTCIDENWRVWIDFNAPALLAMARRAAEHRCPEFPMTTDEFEEPEEE